MTIDHPAALIAVLILGLPFAAALLWDATHGRKSWYRD